ncbi:IS21-like element helper ATPase IstB [Halobacillus karajensis]|uniref:Transposase/IS protein n=1 Tax=Halobacillus karajensis TaxID=195088 RepID=A0A024P8R7_9BACI|nr:IS21-like element helper ATPase IstB [Halobacillus karajensis]CDQ19343.1 transposase/IS protein [Halobacillus karajensis]CDQ19594.1 transposase/IS protein [Halobacillus karajensis]CDQ19596.1 transposase/IS protein [Halobacillus karajensis]CDQ20156.1 transposase/IS protein [Halobacillus karajensis]CDQ20158.1 transposase/IS protein [Halobacillus karajensis]
MMNNQTLTKLLEMKLSGMADAYKEQVSNKEFHKMSFEDRFTLLVDLEHSRRKSNKLQRLIKTATFINSNACIEDIEYHEDRRLDKELILKLASGTYIQDHHNVILKGPTGSGKSFLASAFGVSACRQFYKVKYIRLPELLDELSLAKLAADGSYRKVIKKYKKVDVLILDEWLLTDMSTEEAAILLEITEARHKVASTIFCSQIDPSGWHLKLGNETIAEAILDRIIHDSYQIMIDGDISMRERHGIGAEL